MISQLVICLHIIKMQNNNVYKELPYFLATNSYKPGLKISRRKIHPYTSVANYLEIVEKTNLESTYFYSENIQKIIKNSIKIK